MSIVNQVRIDQTERELLSLREAIGTWVTRRQNADVKRQHHTQLTTLELVLMNALGKIEAGLKGVSPAASGNKVYAECRLFERRVVWVRRLWEYYRGKFDQRNDDDLKEVLAAADEVVWSCYCEIFRKAKEQDSSIERGTAPLPYIDLHYSPHAIPRAESPSDLRSDVDAPFLQNFLKQLPIPIIGLPAVCLQSPWSMIYLGHEVGHHVLHDLLPDLGLQTLFETRLRQTVSAATSDDETTERWEAWGNEIFADLFSILCMGPWALWAMTELELGDESAMFKSKTLYPSPLVRLALMAGMVEKLKLKNPKALNNFSLKQMSDAVHLDASEQAKEAAADLRLVPEVAGAVTTFAVGDVGSIKDLNGWDASEFNAHGLVETLADELQQRIATPILNLRGARLYTSGAVAAWVNMTGAWAEAETLDASQVPDSVERGRQRGSLCEHVMSVVGNSRETGTRSAERSAEKATPTAALETIGAQLGDLLMQADPSELEAQR